jgi:hypothetical protein
MTQSPWNIPPEGSTRAGAWLKGELAVALEALRTLNSGASEPTATAAFMLWADTTNGLLKQRNAANTAWAVLGPLGGALARSQIRAELVSLSATSTKLLFAPPSGFVVERVALISDTATTSSSGNEWTFQITKDPSGTPLDLFSSAPGTFTAVGGVGGGEELAADTVYGLTPDQNATLAADDVLELTATKSGTATAIGELVVLLDGYFTS